MNRVRLLFFFLCLIFSGMLLVWSYFPLERINRVQTLQPIHVSLPPPADVVDLSPTILISPIPDQLPIILSEPQIVINFPSKVRNGGADIIQLVFKINNSETQAITEDSLGLDIGAQETPEYISQNAYHLLAEARLDLVGMQVRPSDFVREPLHPGGSANFFWNIKPAQVGAYQGTAWLYLRITDPSTGQEERDAITAQIMEIKVMDFHGLSTTWVQALAWIGIALALILGIPLLDGLKSNT